MCVCVLNQTFNFEIIVDPYAAVKNNIETSCAPFTCFLSVITSLRKAIVQYLHQEINIDIVKVEHLHHCKHPSGCSCVATLTFLLLTLSLTPHNH